LWYPWAKLLTRLGAKSLQDTLEILHSPAASHQTVSMVDDMIRAVDKRIVVVTDIYTLANRDRQSPDPFVVFEGLHWVIEDGHVPARQCDIVAAWSFMHSTLAETETMRANHGDRKELKKQNVNLGDFKSVILRRIDRKSDKNPESMDREWTCHWLVSGHWRRLNEPRKSDGATMTYVRPHVKGPEDMPFRAPRETVYVAKR